MAGSKFYEDTVYQIINLLKQGELYPKYVDSIDAGKNEYKISQVYTKKNYSTEWIDKLEECIVALDTIVRNPRKFIVIEEDIVDISLARSISVESVKHLSQHTNLISSVTKDGMVIPSKILNTSKEESFEIYENRFIYTLLLKIRDFIEIRSTAIKNALMQSGELGVEVESEFSVDRNKVNYKMSGTANFPFDAVVKRSGSGVTDLERINRISSIISDFLGSPFAREMRSCALVRPPIQRTNVILKDPNFKKALVLWQYIETSEKMQYKIETSTETMEMNPILVDKFRAIVYLNTVLMQSIASTHEASDSVESAKKKQQQAADEYITKNIDDYVPDDFPTLKLDLEQIRTIYKKIPTDKAVTTGQANKLAAAIDRVIRQYRINKAKEDSVTRQKLIAQQLEEEKQAKLLALREEKDAERKARAERARKRLEARRLELERQEELKRLEEEEAELKRKAEEAERRAELHRQELAKIEADDKKYWEEFLAVENAKTEKYEKEEESARAMRDAAQEHYDRSMAEFKAQEDSLEAARRAHIEMVKQEAIERADREERRSALERLTKEEKDSAVRLERERVESLARMKKESEDYWRKEKEDAVSLGVAERINTLQANERAEMEKILGKERVEFDILKKIEHGFTQNLEADYVDHLTTIVDIAYRFHTAEELDRIVDNRQKQFSKEVKDRVKERRRKAKKAAKAEAKQNAKEAKRNEKAGQKKPGIKNLFKKK